MSENQDPNDDPAHALDAHMIRIEADVDRRLAFVRNEFYRMSRPERDELRKCVRRAARRRRPTNRLANISIAVRLAFPKGDDCEVIEASAYQLNKAIKAWSKGKLYLHSAWAEAVR